jgi:hypothetical protein
MHSRLLSLLGISALGATLVACAADSTGPNGSAAGSVSLSFSATGASTTASRTALGGGTLSSALAGSSSVDALVITKAQLVLARLELERAGAQCTSETEAGDDNPSSNEDCAELELAPTVIDLPVNGSVVSALSVAVPAGSYTALEAKIRPVEARRRGASAFFAAHPELANASVRVEGTFNGTAFTYTGAPRAELESLFDPPLVANADGINVTVKVDLTAWFKTSSGTLVDPATANAGGANSALVSANIARSFNAFRDDDHDGNDDRGGRDGEGGDDRGGNSGRH